MIPQTKAKTEVAVLVVTRSDHARPADSGGQTSYANIRKITITHSSPLTTRNSFLIELFPLLLSLNCLPFTRSDHA